MTGLRCRSPLTTKTRGGSWLGARATHEGREWGIINEKKEVILALLNITILFSDNGDKPLDHRFPVLTHF